MSRFDDVDFDQALVRRLMDGDRDAARHVYERLSGPVFSLAARLLKDRHSAAEATQDTFVDVIERASSLEHPGSLTPWVRRIAVNHCLARLRSPWYRRRSWVSPDAAFGGDGHEPTSPPLRLEESRDLDAALQRLSDQARFVVWMHDVEGYTHRQIARLLGRTESFSKSQLARAHARLLEWFDEADRQAESQIVRHGNGALRAGG